MDSRERPLARRTFLADRGVADPMSGGDSHSQSRLVLGTGVGIGLLSSSVSYALTRSLAPSIYWLFGTLCFSFATLLLWKFVLPRFSDYASPLRQIVQWSVAVISFAVLSLITVEAHYSIFGLGRGSILSPYTGGDLQLTIAAETIRHSPWLFAMIPIFPSAILCIVGFNQSWWRIFELEGRQEELRELALSAQLAALRAQINPHFLFNSLNSIAELVRTDPDRAEECIERLAEILRYVLRRTQVDLVPFSEELRIAQSYLDIEKARFGNLLEIRTEVEDEAGAVLLPGLLLQPLVENAVNHGVSRKVGGGVVTIEAGLDNGDLRIAVRDTGVGMERPETAFERGVGLRNLRERLVRRYGDGYEPVVETSAGSGTSIEVRVPRAVG